MNHISLCVWRIASVWALAARAAHYSGAAGVGIVSPRGAPLVLLISQVLEFRAVRFLKCLRMYWVGPAHLCQYIGGLRRAFLNLGVWVDFCLVTLVETDGERGLRIVVVLVKV